MTAAAVKQKPIAIAVPIAAGVAVACIAIALRVVSDSPQRLLHDGLQFVSIADIGGGFSPAGAGAVAAVLFLAGMARR
jgi:hypothetical protein